MEHKITSIEKLTNEKWLNMYRINYEDGRYYLFASRRKQEELVAMVGQKGPDAVRMLPYFKKDGKTYVVFIKEYRSAIDKYIYGLPAGLVDGNESPSVAAARELYEEIGAQAVSIKQTGANLYSTAGLTDESLTLFNVEIIPGKEQHLEATEDISIEVVELSKIPQFLKTHEFCMSSYLMAQSFYFEKVSELISQDEDTHTQGEHSQDDGNGFEL